MVLAHGGIDAAVEMRKLDAPKLVRRTLHIHHTLTHDFEFHLLALELAFHFFGSALNALLNRRQFVACQDLLDLGERKAHRLVELAVPQQIDLPIVVITISVCRVDFGLDDALLLVETQGVPRDAELLPDLLLRAAHLLCLLKILLSLTWG